MVSSFSSEESSYYRFIFNFSPPKCETALPCSERGDAKQPRPRWSGLSLPRGAHIRGSPRIKVRPCYQGVFCGFLFVAQEAIEERQDLPTRASCIRAERGIAGARGDALLNGQQHSVVIIGVSGNVYKVHFRALGLGAVLLSI